MKEITKGNNKDITPCEIIDRPPIRLLYCDRCNTNMKRILFSDSHVNISHVFLLIKLVDTTNMDRILVN